MWGELMGQSFSMPVDDLGPGRPVVMPGVLSRMSASFKGSEYDIKGLMRLVCNSETYQRELRPGESAELKGSDGHVYTLLSGIYVVGLILIWFMPETKGKPLPD